MNGSRTLLVAVVVAALFGAACGVLGGIGVVHFVAFHHPGVFRQLMHGGRPPMGAGEGRYGPPIERLTRDLGLSDSQRTGIESEIDRTRREGHALRESLRVRIERQLTPGQRTRFEALAPPDTGPGSARPHWRGPHRAAPGEEGDGSR